MTTSSFGMRASKNKELHEQSILLICLEILDQKFKQELDRTAEDAHRETRRYIANLQSTLDFLEEKLQISQDHDMLDGSDREYRTANTLHVTDDHLVSCEGEAEV